MAQDREMMDAFRVREKLTELDGNEWFYVKSRELLPDGCPHMTTRIPISSIQALVRQRDGLLEAAADVNGYLIEHDADQNEWGTKALARLQSAIEKAENNL